MATLEKIRSMKYLLIGFVGFALLAFIIQGLFSGISFFQEDRNTVAEVNGTAIKIEEYQTLLERNLENTRAQKPDGSVSEIEENQMRNNILNSLIQQELLRGLTNKVGFTVGKEELTELFLGEEVSPLLQQYFTNPNTGVFDREGLRNYIAIVQEEDFDFEENPDVAYEQAQAKQMWSELTNQVKQQQLSAKFSNFLSSAINYNELEQKANYENNKVKVDFDYAMLPYSSMSDDGFDVSDDEIRKLYEERKSRYPQDEARIIDYIRVNVVPSEKDLADEQIAFQQLKTQLETTENVAPLVNHNSPTLPYKEGYRSYNELTAEEKRFVENNPVATVSDPIRNGNVFSLYKYEAEKMAPDTIAFNIMAVSNIIDEASKQLGDSLINAIKSSSFAAVSLAQTGGRFDGNYGRQTEQAILEAENRVFDTKFKDDIFNAPINEPVLIPLNNRGYFIVQVTEKNAPVMKYKLASIRKEVKASKETRNETYNKLSRYISTNRDLQAFRDSASVANYMVYQDVQLKKDGTSIGGIEDTRQIIQWAFQNEVGSISKIYEARNYENLIVAAVREVREKGVQSMDDVKEALRRELIADKKAEKIINDYKAGNYSDLEQVTTAWGVSPSQVKGVSYGMTSSISGIGNEAVIYARADQAPVGKLSEPLKGKSGVFVLYVTDKKASEDPYNSDTAKRQMEMQNQQRIQQMLYNPKLLTENAEIEDNSINFPYYR